MTDRYETSRHLDNKNDKPDINKIIIRYNLNNDLNNNKFINFRCFRKIKDIFLFLILILIILGLIKFFTLYHSTKNNKINISFKQYANNTNKDGYYIPKDKLLNPVYKKCSIENCKKCYGNSYKDTCMSCFSSYYPIIDKNNKIISCEYIPLINETITDKIIPNSEPTKELITTDINEKTDLLSERFIETSSEVTNKYSNIISQQTIISEIITENIIINCEPGYYLPEGNKNNECKKCSLLGCEICHGNNTIDYCDSCFLNYTQIFKNNNLICIECGKNCLECNQSTIDECIKCKDEYVLFHGKCYAYSFAAELHTDYDNKYLYIHPAYFDSYYIDYIILDNKMIKNDYYDFTFSKSGSHIVYFSLKNNPTSFYRLFNGDYYYYYYNTLLLSVNFTSYFKTENITNLSGMFAYCNDLVSINFSNFDTSNVKYMSYMFFYCEKLTSLNLQCFNTTNVEDMSYMFFYCEKLTSLNLQCFNTTNIEDTSYMFYYCEKLTSLNLQCFNTTNVEDMSYMFYYCEKLTSLNLQCFNTTNIEDTSYMFYHCSSLISLNLNSFDTSKVKNMNEMFFGCSSLVYLNISNFVGNSLSYCRYIFGYVNKSIIYMNEKFKQTLINLCWY